MQTNKEEMIVTVSCYCFLEMLNKVEDQRFAVILFHVTNNLLF